MQQAGTADSTRHPFDVTGKEGDISAAGARQSLDAVTVRTFNLVTDVEDRIESALREMGTLIKVAAEVADEAMAETGFWYRQAGYHRERLELVSDLMAMVEDRRRLASVAALELDGFARTLKRRAA